jgi:hypothetical protein
MHSVEQFAATILAETFAAKASGTNVGVLGENLPRFDIPTFVQELEKLHPSPFWLAILGVEEISMETNGKSEITYDVTIANQWRNQATENRERKLFVVVMAKTRKLKSLQDLLVRVTESELRPTLEKRAVSWYGTDERKAFWKLLSQDRDNFKTSSLLDFAATVEGISENDLQDAEEKSLYKLALLPYTGLLDLEGPKKIESGLKADIALVERIKSLSKHDIQTIARILNDETTPDEDRNTARNILAFSKSKDRECLQGLEVSTLRRLLTLRKPDERPIQENEGDAVPHAVRKERELGDESAIKDLLRNAGNGLDDISDIYQNDPDEDSEPKEFMTDGRTVIQKYRTGTSQAHFTVNQLVTDEFFGGIVRAENALDYIECLKMVEGGETGTITKFQPNNELDRKSIKSILNEVMRHFQDTSITEAYEAWKRYVETRENLREFRFDLLDHPLLTLVSNPDVVNACDLLIKAYSTMVGSIAKVCDDLRRDDPDVGRALMARVVALDIIYLEYKGGCIAIAAPTHPFHLWRWVEIARLFNQHRDDMLGLGEELLLRTAANPPVFSPHVALSSHLDPDNIEKDRIFVGIGAIGALPLYGDPESRVAAKFRAEKIADLATRFVGIAPYAAFGFEVAAIDPPGVADIIEAVVSVNRGRTRNNLIPVHVRIFFTRTRVGTTDEEDAEMEELASVMRDIKGSLEIEPSTLSMEQVHRRLVERPVHYAMIFEPGDSQKFQISIDFSPTLSPLVLPRHYRYSPISDKFDVIIHGEALPFNSYYDLFRDITNIADKGTFGRRSGAGRNIDVIQNISKHAMWVSVVDQGIEPTFKIAGTIRIDKDTSGGRDIHTFTAHENAIIRYVKQIIEKADLVPDEPTQKRTMELMQRLGGDTIPLAVSSASRNGQILDKQAKGLMGVLAVKAWYELSDPDALLVSLDTDASRRWILGLASEEDGRRGDLLCLRQTYEGLQVDVVEVKAREDASDLFRTRGASTIEGHAISQIDNTIAVLKRILPKTAASVDRARREVLRDQLYMSVAHKDMSPEQRGRAVRMLEEFFNAESVNITGRLFVVTIATHRVPSYPMEPSKKNIQSLVGNPIEVYEIVESEVPEPGEPQELEPTPESGPSPNTPKRVRTKWPETKAGSETKKTGEVPSEPPPVKHIRTKFPEPKKEETKPAMDELVESAEIVSPPSQPQTEDNEVIPEKRKSPTPKQAVLIGTDPLGNSVTWDPDPEQNPNFGISITGDPGYGKTQTIRAIVSELRSQGYPALFFDFKNDYSDPAFVEELNLTVYDVVENGLPFNPLTLMPNESGMVQPVRQCHDLSSIIARVEGLKEQQTHRLTEAIKHVYELHNINPLTKISVETITSEPVFSEVLLELANGDEVAKTVSYRLQKFIDLGLFPTEPVDLNFEELIRDGIVLTMNDEANAKLMQILAEIMIVKIHALVKRGEQPRKLTRVLVFDEAWRIAKSQRLVELAREGRAFGIGLLIGTQKPKDIPEYLMSCLGTQIYLANNEPDDQKIILKALCNTSSGPTAERQLRAIKGLGIFEGFIRSNQYRSGLRVNILPHKDRER